MQKNKFDESDMQYKPGQIVKSGSRTYQADGWGVLQPVASKNQSYINRKKRLMKGVNKNE
jgi:hypothetical protein